MVVTVAALYVGTWWDRPGSSLERFIVVSIYALVPSAVVASAKWVLASEPKDGLRWAAIFRIRPTNAGHYQSWLWGRLATTLFALTLFAMCVLAVTVAW
jgi:hypothetical protein